MLTKSHSKASKKDRKASKTPASRGMPTLTEKYAKSDETVDAVYADIANGASRSDCLQKIQLGMYGNKPVKARQSAYIYNAALDRFDAVAKNDFYNARGILDSMARIFGVEKKGPDTAIQINNSKDGMTVNFMFPNEEEEEDGL